MTLYSFLDAIENVHKDSMAKDANTSADAKMEQSMYSLLTFDYFYNILYFFINISFVSKYVTMLAILIVRNLKAIKR